MNKPLNLGAVLPCPSVTQTLNKTLAVLCPHVLNKQQNRVWMKFDQNWNHTLSQKQTFVFCRSVTDRFLLFLRQKMRLKHFLITHLKVGGLGRTDFIGRYFFIITHFQGIN